MDLGKKAKQTLQEYAPLIDAKISSYLDTELEKKFGFNPRHKETAYELLEHSKAHCLRPSKRLRSSFVHYGFLLSGKEVGEVVWDAAVALELVHTAILMQDDVMDGDEIRRGMRTPRMHYQDKGLTPHLAEAMSICAADVLLCLGFELLERCGNREAMLKMLRGITNTAYGQAYDLMLLSLGKWNDDDVISLHKAKTAIYTYENPLLIGAKLAGITDLQVHTLLSSYAMDGGVAFQLQDDILGVFGSLEKTGKSADTDLLQGKCTLLISHLLKNGTQEQKETLGPVWGKGNASQEDISAVKKAILDCGSYEYSKKKAKALAQHAVMTAAKLREKKELNTEAIDYIQGIAEYMVDREV